MKNNRQIELLAPAKNMEQGKLAITCGADAVYIGADRFGARAKVGNTVEDVAELVKFASQYYANVYVTINTLLFDDELENAVKLIHQCHDIGVNGIIIQDMGLLEFDLPDIPIIASTQCFVNTPEKAKFFQDLGFKRLILPRELSLNQIHKIRENASNVELEYFVHGALCVCYSGQCYMSYALGGRSGNRGVCAQPCRKLYTITDSTGKIIAKDKHLLSIKDLNMSSHIGELIEAGITSFKIEGRLKDETYIKNIVTYYRKEIDKYLDEKNLERSSSGKTTFNFDPDPGKSFNRHYSDYFFSGKQQNIGSIDTPKMQGEFIGKIKSIKSDFFILEGNHNLTNGDGISFFGKGKLSGTQVNKSEGKKVYPNSMKEIKVGMKIFRNYDHQFNKGLNSAKISRSIEMTIRIEDFATGYQFVANDEDGNTATLSVMKMEIADNQDMAKANIISNLSKTGSSIFHCNKVDIELHDIPFLRKSEINQIRRDLLEKLLENRIANKPLSKGKIEKNDIPYITDKLDYRGNVVNEKAREFYLRHGVKIIEDGAETGIDLTNQVLMTTRYCIRKELGQCQKETDNNSQWFMEDAEGNKFRLKFRCNVCEMDVIKEN